MKKALFFLLLLLPVLASAQTDKLRAGIATFSGFAVSGAAEYTGDVSGFLDVWATNYRADSIAVNDLIIDATGHQYRVDFVNSATPTTASIVVISLQTPHKTPVGRGVIWEPIGSNLMPPAPWNNLEITPYLRSLIDGHNIEQLKAAAGVNVNQITVLGDTASYTVPNEGDVLIKSDSTLAAFYNGTQWLVLTGGSGGGGGADDWGSQVVQSDATITGDGTAGNLLGVNTSTIATTTYADQAEQDAKDYADANDADTQLTQEQVEDFTGGMVTGNTETLITVTYQDGDGTIDFVVDNDLSNYDNSASGFITSQTDDQDASEVNVIVQNGVAGPTVQDELEDLRADLASGGDGWGTDVVNSDATLTGDGTAGTPLKADTSVIATLYALQDTAAAVRGDFPTGFSGSWNDLANVPADFADNTDNEGTDDQDAAEVNVIVQNGVTGPTVQDEQELIILELSRRIKKASNLLIVDVNGDGDYTTISAAISAADSLIGSVGISVRPGVYSENIVLNNRDSIYIFSQVPNGAIISHETPGVSTSTITISRDEISINGFTIISNGSNSKTAINVTGTGDVFFVQNIVDGNNSNNMNAFLNNSSPNLIVYNNVFFNQKVTPGTRRGIVSSGGRFFSNYIEAEQGTGQAYSVSGGLYFSNVSIGFCSVTSGEFRNESYSSLSIGVGGASPPIFRNCTVDLEVDFNNSYSVNVSGSAEFHNCSIFHEFDGAASSGAVNIAAAGITVNFIGGTIVQTDQTATLSNAVRNTSGGSSTVNFYGTTISGQIDYTDLTVGGSTPIGYTAPDLSSVQLAGRFTTDRTKTTNPLDISSNTGAARMTIGTTANRPIGQQGMSARYNTTWSGFEGHNGTAWRRFPTYPDATPTEGQIIKWMSGEWILASDATGGGGMTSFDITGDTGTPSEIGDGETVTISGGNLITATSDGANGIQLDVASGVLTGTTSAGSIPIGNGSTALTTLVGFERSGSYIYHPTDFASVLGRGTTANRPAAVQGGHYYDITLDEPTISNGSAYRRVPTYPDATPTEGQYMKYSSGAWALAAAPPTKSSATLLGSNLPSIAAGDTYDFTITVTGASVGAGVMFAPSALPAGLMAYAWVSSSNTVTVRLHNTTGSAVDPATASYTAIVIE